MRANFVKKFLKKFLKKSAKKFLKKLGAIFAPHLQINYRGDV